MYPLLNLARRPNLQVYFRACRAVPASIQAALLYVNAERRVAFIHYPPVAGDMWMGLWKCLQAALSLSLLFLFLILYEWIERNSSRSNRGGGQRGKVHRTL